MNETIVWNKWRSWRKKNLPILFWYFTRLNTVNSKSMMSWQKINQVFELYERIDSFKERHALDISEGKTKPRDTNEKEILNGIWNKNPRDAPDFHCTWHCSWKWVYAISNAIDSWVVIDHNSTRERQIVIGFKDVLRLLDHLLLQWIHRELAHLTLNIVQVVGD